MDKLHANEYPPNVFVYVKMNLIIRLRRCVIPFCSILILDVFRWGETVLHSDCARRLHPALAVCVRAFPSRSHPSIREATEESHPTRAEMILLNPNVPLSLWVCSSLVSDQHFLIYFSSTSCRGGEILEFHSKAAKYPKLKGGKVCSFSYRSSKRFGVL